MDGFGGTELPSDLFGACLPRGRAGADESVGPASPCGIASHTRVCINQSRALSANHSWVSNSGEGSTGWTSHRTVR